VPICAAVAAGPQHATPTQIAAWNANPAVDRGTWPIIVEALLEAAPLPGK
jgi:hypothetical protein